MAKGYGILLVILGHLGVGWIGTWIYSFHMPLFFFLSGYCFHARTPFWTFLKRKMKTMVLPYFALGVPTILFAWLNQWYGPVSGDVLLDIIKEYVIQCGRWDVWFLACLFCLNLIYWGILVKIHSIKIQLLLTVLMPIFGYLYILVMGERYPLPWNVDISLMAAPFFYAGHQFSKYEDRIWTKINSWKKRVIAFLLLAITNVSFYIISKELSGESLNMFSGKYGILPVSIICAFAGIGCMILISQRLTLFPVRYLGENSLLYFAWHEQLAIPICGAFLSLIGLPWNDYWNSAQKLGYQFLQLCIILLMLTAANLLITKT